MNKQTRIEKIQEIIERDKENPFGKQEIPWEDGLKTMNVYKIPTAYLIYNKYNGRILSRTQSLENQNQKIDAETNEGMALIEQLLWDSKPDRNKKTLKSISDFGQEKVGIITKDGIIIDGNRRAMLLKKSGKYDYFKAVVLDVTSEENPIEIEKLETSYQMGEDEKLGYNAVEKYLKSKGLYYRLANKKFNADNIDKAAIKKIADWMGEKDSIVVEYLTIMETMDDYLDYLEYNGIYTQLDGREDQFIKLTKWLNTFYGKESPKAFDGYKDDDVDDLKAISYDYIRIQYDGKKFRYIADGLKPNHFFGNKNIWEDFCDFHFENKTKIAEEPIDKNSKNLHAHLDDRDNIFLERTKLSGINSFMDENVDSHYQQLKYNQASGEPEKLVKSAKKALESINQKHKSFSQPAVLNEVAELTDFITEMLQKKSALRLMSHVIDLLKSVNINSNEDSEELLTKTKEIQSIAYNLGKTIKKSSHTD
jgi:hypothetical protein